MVAEIKKKHRGKIVEEILNKKGHKKKAIAHNLNISRATLYKRLRSGDMSDLFLFNLGKLIGVRFEEVFPELRNSVFYESVSERSTGLPEETVLQFKEAQQKYTLLLEDYNRLLRFLVRLMDTNEFYSIKDEISVFIEDHLRNDRRK